MHGSLEMIRAVIFDFDGTLVDFVQSDITALKHVHRISEAKCSSYEFINAAIEGIMKFHEMVDLGEIDPLLVFQYRLSYAFKKTKTLPDTSYTEEYKTKLLEETRAYSGVVQLLSKLKTSFSLGLITNAYDGLLQRQRIEMAGLSPFFDEILIAGETGISKPDPEIFWLMSSKLKIPPEECLFVGDSPIYDIEGAHYAGMKTVFFGSTTESDVPDYYANCIRELALLLDRIFVNQYTHKANNYLRRCKDKGFAVLH